MNVNTYDIICIYETWLEKEPLIKKELQVKGFSVIFVPATRRAHRGRAAGGIACLLNLSIYNIDNVRSCENYLLLRIINFNVILGIIYVSPNTELEDKLKNFSESLNLMENLFPNSARLIGGDFNARIGESSNVIDDCLLESLNFFDYRSSLDKVINTRGYTLCNCMENLGLVLVNGRSYADSPAHYT